MQLEVGEREREREGGRERGRDLNVLDGWVGDNSSHYSFDIWFEREVIAECHVFEASGASLNTCLFFRYLNGFSVFIDHGIAGGSV